MYGICWQRVWSWCGMALLLSVLPLSSARAQTSRFPTTPAAVSARRAELKDPAANLPEDQVLIEDEIRRLGDEREAYRAALVSEEGVQAALADVDSMKGVGTRAIEAARQLDCSRATVRDNAQVLGSMSRIRSWVFFRDDEPGSSADPWSTMFQGRNLENASPAEVCQAIKQEFADPQIQAQLLAFFDQQKAKLQAQADEQQKQSAEMRELVNLIDKRRVALQNKLRGLTTQQQIGANLWLVILAIGALSVGTILVIKLFPEALQVEWVASGQVIQFVTVMVLLSAIMALGLSNILRENTIGTLLGGIAGYVLSQGVGRATAREVARARSETP